MTDIQAAMGISQLKKLNFSCLKGLILQKILFRTTGLLQSTFDQL